MSGSLRHGNLAIGLAREMGFPICWVQLPRPENTFSECLCSVPTPQILGLGAFLAAELFWMGTRFRGVRIWSCLPQSNLYKAQENLFEVCGFMGQEKREKEVIFNMLLALVSPERSSDYSYLSYSLCHLEVDSPCVSQMALNFWPFRFRSQSVGAIGVSSQLAGFYLGLVARELIFIFSSFLLQFPFFLYP